VRLCGVRFTTIVLYPRSPLPCRPFHPPPPPSSLLCRAGEGNSVACGGAYNVSDTMASALWAVDELFNVAAVNITRWNFHGCPGELGWGGGGRDALA
jgi:hypothetical protein